MAKSMQDSADDIARNNYMAAVTAANAAKKAKAAKDAEWKAASATAQQLDNERYQLQQVVERTALAETNARAAFTVCSI